MFWQMVRKFIKRVPMLGSIAKSVRRKIHKRSVFETSDKYWEDRYHKGGNSGAGSYNRLAEFKAEVINSFVKDNGLKTAIEFGCGDGNQLEYLNYESYIGYDVSEKAIEICLKRFRNDASKQFRLLKEFEKETADLTISLDVIYHVVEDDKFGEYMSKLFDSSHAYVVVYSSNHEGSSSRGKHVRHRMFTTWVEENRPQFKLVKHIPNRYPYNGNVQESSFADFYIFQLVEASK